MRDFISTSCIVNLSFLDSFKGSKHNPISYTHVPIYIHVHVHFGLLFFFLFTGIWSDEQVSLLRKRSTLSIIQIEEDVGHRPVSGVCQTQYHWVLSNVQCFCLESYFLIKEQPGYGSRQEKPGEAHSVLCQ